MSERVLWRAERERFLRVLDKIDRHMQRRRAEMMILYDTGCRVSELAALNMADYNKQRKSLMLINVKAKDHPRREVPLHDKTVRAINAWLRVRPQKDSEALFTSQKGNRLSVRQIQDDYNLVCKLAGVDPHHGVHTLRHTSATALLDDKVLQIHQVSRRLGHSQIATTYRYYVHGSVEEEAEAIGRRRI